MSSLEAAKLVCAARRSTVPAGTVMPSSKLSDGNVGKSSAGRPWTRNLLFSHSTVTCSASPLTRTGLGGSARIMSVSFRAGSVTRPGDSTFAFTWIVTDRSRSVAESASSSDSALSRTFPMIGSGVRAGTMLATALSASMNSLCPIVNCILPPMMSGCYPQKTKISKISGSTNLPIRSSSSSGSAVDSARSGPGSWRPAVTNPPPCRLELLGLECGPLACFWGETWETSRYRFPSTPSRSFILSAVHTGEPQEAMRSRSCSTRTRMVRSSRISFSTLSHA